MIDKKFIGAVLPKSVLEIEKGRLRFFAKATGETNPIYTDEAAAKTAGYASLPVPPTFIFAAELDANTLIPMMQEMNVNLGRILHGEQKFSYLAPICAGDHHHRRVEDQRRLREEERHTRIHCQGFDRHQPAR